MKDQATVSAASLRRRADAIERSNEKCSENRIWLLEEAMLLRKTAREIERLRSEIKKRAHTIRCGEGESVLRNMAATYFELIVKDDSE